MHAAVWLINLKKERAGKNRRGNNTGEKAINYTLDASVSLLLGTSCFLSALIMH